jgi:hypothetical protein
MLSILHYCVQRTFIVGFFQKQNKLQRIPHHIPIPPTVILDNRIHIMVVQHLTQQMEQTLQQWELHNHPRMSPKLHMTITDWSSKTCRNVRQI